MQEHKEKNTNAYLVCIDKYLDYWITKGIAFLEVEKKRKINNSLIENKLLIHLPEKYKLITEKTNQIPVLIDDVEQIISPTEEQTRFLRTKYNTLGESWIPFKSEPNSQINEVFLAKIQKTMMSTNTKKQSKTKSNSGKKSSEEIQGELPLGQSCQYHNPELSASNNGSSLIDLFNDYGGIQYSVVSSFDYIRESPERDFALLLWLIFSEAIARAGNIKNCWIWIEYQLSYLKQATSALEKKLRKYIETLSLWSPLLVLLSASQSQSDEEFINQLNSSNALYCENEALRAILRIIIHLFRKQGKYLFSPGNWGDNEVKPSRENITDPQQCSIVKLGIILKNLIESEGENSTQ
ncbi:MAG: hypothetical protein QXL34_07455, partial [Thermosphaera sp.]